MPHLPLTYTLAVAPCLTFGGRTIEAVGGTADGFGSGGRDEAFFYPPHLQTLNGSELKRMHTKGQALRVPPIGRRRTVALTEKRLLS